MYDQDNKDQLIPSPPTYWRSVIESGYLGKNGFNYAYITSKIWDCPDNMSWRTPTGEIYARFASYSANRTLTHYNHPSDPYPRRVDVEKSGRNLIYLIEADTTEANETQLWYYGRAIEDNFRYPHNNGMNVLFTGGNVGLNPRNHVMFASHITDPATKNWWFYN